MLPVLPFPPDLLIATLAFCCLDIAVHLLAWRPLNILFPLPGHSLLQIPHMVQFVSHFYTLLISSSLSVRPSLTSCDKPLSSASHPFFQHHEGLTGLHSETLTPKKFRHK